MAPPKAKKPGSSESSHTFRPNDVVLAKMSGYPFWPAIIQADTDVPARVLKQKRSRFIVRFMPAADYGFVSGRDLKPLPAEAIAQFLNNPAHEKQELYRAYQAAKDPEKWTKEADEALRAAEAFHTEAAEGEDELEGDDDDDDDKPAKKRKSNSGSKVREGKKPGASKKAKGESNGDAKAGKKRKADGSAKDAAKDKGGDDDDGSELDPASKKVKGWRHELQRNFLGKDGVIADAMDKSAEVYETLENYSEMTVKQLQDSKILKVLKKISGLKPGEIPAEAEEKHNFKARTEKLHSKWQDILNADGKPSSSAGKDEPGDLTAAPPAPTENGTADADKPVQEKPAEEAKPTEAAADKPSEA